MMTTVGYVLSHALWLLALCFVPFGPSPAPDLAPEDTRLWGALAIVVFGLLAFVATRLRRLLSRVAPFAVAAIGLTVIASLALAYAVPRSGLPLGEGVLYLLMPAWTSLALVAAALADEYLGTRFKNKRMGAAVIIIAIGIFNWRGAFERFGSTEAIWRAALATDPGHPDALRALGKELLETESAAELDALADACESRHPGACSCLRLRSEASIRTRAYAEASRVAMAYVDASCPEPEPVYAIAALADAQRGEAQSAIELAKHAVNLGLERDLLRRHFALAIAYRRLGEFDRAEEEAELAQEVALGDQRRWILWELARISLDANRLDQAAERATALVEDDDRDADAFFFLGEVHERREDFGAAEQAYGRAAGLRLAWAEAAYRRTISAHRNGDDARAKALAAEFVRRFPGHERTPELKRFLQSPLL